jgi:hypothetical protein
MVEPTADSRGGPGLRIHLGYGLYASGTVDLRRPRDTLSTWARSGSTASTAFAAMYLPWEPGVAGPEAGERPVRCPLPLSPPQREVVRRARHEAVTVVAGPPGTGKSQTAVAIALDEVAAGRSVLVATQSAVAADVLADLLERVPGPDPVRFGGGRKARSLADRLGDGAPPPPPDDAVDRTLARADADEAALREAAAADFWFVRNVNEWHRESLTINADAAFAPRLFDGTTSVHLPELHVLFGRASITKGLRRWWARRSERKLRELLGAPADATLPDIQRAMSLAMRRDQYQRAGTRSARDAERRLDAWADAADRADRAWAAHLDGEVRGRIANAERQAVGALATALRSGQATRRNLLQSIDVRALTRALPLWIGTLGEIETLLPATPGAFDLVILDEASQIDQISASAALLRAKRAVVIGDPRQLRFVSFVADRSVDAAVADHDAHDLRARLDIRRVSAFDLAASTAPVTTLDEHYRSVPHLIGFSARRFYDGRLHVATTHPRTEGVCAIEVRALDGLRTDGINQVEVAAAVDEVEAVLDADDLTTIGVVSPYRAQVDAIDALIAERIDISRLERGRVRIGTVHQFQGGECDVVVASFAVGGASDRGRPFLEDPNLFNVLVTRARRRMVVLQSGEAPRTGLLADYLRWASSAPGRPPDGSADLRWTNDLADVLRDAAVPVRVAYPAGRWTVDLVIGDGERAVAVTTGEHPDGPEAHLDRYAALRRAGWRQAEAFPSTTDWDPIPAALALARLVG